MSINPSILGHCSDLDRPSTSKGGSRIDTSMPRVRMVTKVDDEFLSDSLNDTGPKIEIENDSFFQNIDDLNFSIKHNRQ